MYFVHCELKSKKKTKNTKGNHKDLYTWNEGKKDEWTASKAAELSHLNLCHSDGIYFKPKKLKLAFPKILFIA